MGNHFMVGVHGNEIVVQRVQPRMTAEEALNLAAWLVAIAGTISREGEDAREIFDELYEEAIDS